MAELGRPTEYNDEICKGAQVYLESAIADDSKELPTIEGLALALGISRPTVYDWREKHEEFSYIVENILAHQSKSLINKGLSGTYNASITKLMLTKHGYVEKTATDLTTDGKPLAVNAVMYANNPPQVQPEAVPAPSTESTG